LKFKERAGSRFVDLGERSDIKQKRCSLDAIILFVFVSAAIRRAATKGSCDTQLYLYVILIYQLQGEECF